MAAHKDIRIKFEVEGRRYEAVGFLNKGESSVDGNTMFSRTAGENGGVIRDDDEAFLSEHRSKFPKELRKYYLVTGTYSPGDSRFVACFGWNVWGLGGWDRCWGDLTTPWYGNNWWRGRGLVLRRCA